MPTRYVPQPKLELKEDSDDSTNVKQEDDDDGNDHNDGSNDHSNDNHSVDDDANSSTSLISNKMFTEDKFYFLQLSYSYTCPLFPYPLYDATHALQSAYNAQSIAYDKYEDEEGRGRSFSCK